MFKGFDRPLLRTTIVEFSFYLCSLVIVSRLFYIQVILHKDYEAKANDQHWDSKIITAKRGDIYTSDAYPVATTKISYLVYVEPKKIKDPKETAQILSSVLFQKDQDQKELTQNTNESSVEEVQSIITKDLMWIAVKRKVSNEEINVLRKTLKESGIQGVGFEEEPLRYYPEGKFASHILGFLAGSQDLEDKGYFGLEGYFDGDLRGKPGKILQEIGATGGAILIGGYRKTPSIDGKDLYLTINREAQFMVEEKLKEGVKNYQAKSGSVVIVKPDTGDILVMANYPTFDPSDIAPKVKESSESEEVMMKNISITDLYEPGSIMKPLTISSAMDLGLVSPTSTFNDEGPMTYSGYTINNWNGIHHGVQTITQLFEKSNNIGAAIVGTKVGASKLYEYFKKFGLGELTRITLEGENTSTLRNTSDWKDIDVATASFGQGISATALQMAMAFSVFDNGGFLMKPRIVSKMTDTKRTIEFPKNVRRRVISEKVSDQISQMLISAVDNGEARFFNVKGYSIAGKTGTAQIPVNGSYDPNKTNATFIGFLPNVSQDKKFVMIVRLEEPTKSIFAAETAVPLWMTIFRELALLYKIPPDRM